MLPRVAPELSMDTYWYYKNAHTIDQKWSVRACGVRQRHIDQAQSVNLYITNEYTLRQVLEQIREQTKLQFMMSKEQGERVGRVSVDAVNETVAEVLDKVFASTGLTWVVKDILLW